MSDDYPYIRKWGTYAGSLPSYVDEQVARARETGAPQNAVYEIHDNGPTGVWRTTDNITNPAARRFLGLA
jgi:hypothetical protein